MRRTHEDMALRIHPSGALVAAVDFHPLAPDTPDTLKARAWAGNNTEDLRWPQVRQAALAWPKLYWQEPMVPLTYAFCQKGDDFCGKYEQSAFLQAMWRLEHDICRSNPALFYHVDEHDDPDILIVGAKLADVEDWDDLDMAKGAWDTGHSWDITPVSEDKLGYCHFDFEEGGRVRQAIVAIDEARPWPVSKSVAGHEVGVHALLLWSHDPDTPGRWSYKHHGAVFGLGKREKVWARQTLGMED